MNAHHDRLRDIHLTGGVFLEAQFTAPWCITAQVGPEDCAPFTPQPRHVIAYHFVSLGHLELLVNGQPPLIVDAGDLVVLPRNDVHIIGSDVTLEPVDAAGLIQAGNDGGTARIVHGGGGESTQVFCGFLGNDQPENPVFAMLPSVLKLNVTHGISDVWIESAFRFGVREQSRNEARSGSILARLAELLFLDAVSRYITEDPGRHRAWTQGLEDSKVARALDLIHSRIAEHWTTERLAREVGLSRSAFAERFTRALKEPPMTYLCRQRLEQASIELRNSSASIPAIASAIGYESEAAFSRAFKRVYGTPPATWRKEHPAWI